MIIKYKLDKIFGPSGSFSGLVLFIVGLATIYFSYISIFFALLGAFFAFSYTGTQIKIKQKEYKFYNNLFGVIMMGKWISIKTYTKLHLAHSRREYTSYSLSNRRMDLLKVDYRIYISKNDGAEKLPVCKCKTLEEAIAEIEILAQQLQLPVPEDLK